MKPRILLIGAGKFGRNHLRVLQALSAEGRVELAGVVVRNKERYHSLAAQGIPVFGELTTALLQRVQAVAIVTPPSAHYELIKACLPHAHVFTEKPLALQVNQAEELARMAGHAARILFVGHIFRFNGAVQKLKSMFRHSRRRYYQIHGEFSGSRAQPDKDCGVVASDLHLFDVLDYVLEESPTALYCCLPTRSRDYAFEEAAAILLAYDRGLSASLRLSWGGVEKVRRLTLYARDQELIADLDRQAITMRRPDRPDQVVQCCAGEPLRLELESFVSLLGGKDVPYPDAQVGVRIAHLVDRAYESARKNQVVRV